MTNLEHHVTSLALSQRLHELRVKKDSYFYWVLTVYKKGLKGNIISTKWVIGDENIVRVAKQRHECLDLCSAYLASELMQLLPCRYKEMSKDENDVQHERWYPLALVKNDDSYNAGMGTEWNGSIGFYAESAADALARMVIHCIESGLLKVGGE